MEPSQAFQEISAGTNLSLTVPYDLIVKGKEYKGQIQYRFPNVRDEIHIGLEEAKLRGTIVELAGRPELITVPYESVDKFTAFLIEGIATLKVLSLNKGINFEQFPQEVIVEIHRGYLFQQNGEGEDTEGVNTSDDGSNTSEVTEPSSTDITQ